MQADRHADCIEYTEQDLDQATQTLYALVLADDELSRFFVGKDVAAIERRQRQFIGYVLDPAAHDADTPYDLGRIHAPLRRQGLNHSHFDQLIEYLRIALAETAIAPSSIDAICARLETTRTDVVGEDHTHFPIKEKTMFGRLTSMIYAVASYAAGMAVLAYAAGWMGGFLVPNQLDGPATGSMLWGIAVNIGLVAIFALQHSVMARPAFKAWWTKIIPAECERATYVLASAVAMFAMMWFWQPLGVEIWTLTGGAAVAMYVTYAVGWAILVSATFCLNHFDLFGLRQAWLNLRGKAYTNLPFATPFYYRLVRHPLYVGWLVLIWATPTMTISHLVFAIATTAYILFAIPLEERDLERMMPEYADYKANTPALIPRLRRRDTTVRERTV